MLKYKMGILEVIKFKLLLNVPITIVIKLLVLS